MSECRESSKKANICDSSALIYRLERCKQLDHIYLPVAHKAIIERIANGKIKGSNIPEINQQVQELAKKAKKYVRKNKEWCTVIPKLGRERYNVDINKFNPKDKTRATVALACELSRQGFDVCVYTRDWKTQDLVELQSIKVVYMSSK